MNLLKDIHVGLPSPASVSYSTALVSGSYDYYHYLSDEVNDVGWGCGYRTLQTLCSWIKYQMEGQESINCCEVPTIIDIQKALVQIGDKPKAFIGSKQWIGSVEVSFCIDHFYKVQSKIMHFKNIEELKLHENDIREHFELYGSPFMMGGDQDCSSKGVLGIGKSEESLYLLILDPHFYGHGECKDKLQAEGWIKWQNVNSLDQSSFYNLCCPLLKSNKVIAL